MSDENAPKLFVTILDRRLSRRTLLRGIGIGGAGLATAGFVACGDDDDETSTTTTDDDRGTTTGRRPTGATSSGEVDGTSSFVYGFPAPHAGILFAHYNAQEKGFWEEEGLEVEIEYQTAGIPLVAGGTVDYGEVSADELLNAYAAGPGS